MIQNLKTQLRIMQLSKIKPNFSELARQYSIDRRTVKKYYDGYTGKPKHRSKPSKLDQYQDLIKHKLSIKGTNVRAVYEFIISGVDANITYKLGNSRYTRFIYKLYKTRQDVFECLIDAFKSAGGVPREILFDNMSSVVDRDGNKINISNQMKAFAKDFNFKIKLCKPRHPFTKGKVESANKFMTWLLPYEHEFETEAELQAILDKISNKVNTSPCQETGVPPLLLFQKEKEYLQSLPKDDVIESYLTHDRQTIVRADSLVTFMNSKYSVSPEYIGKPVRLRVSDDILYIYFNTEQIAVHKISNKIPIHKNR